METWDAASLHTLERLRLWVELQVAEHPRPLMLGIGGPGGCGKSSVARWLERTLGNGVILELDDFRLPRAERPAHARFGSHPDAIDWDRLAKVLEEAKGGGLVRQPIFDRIKGRATEEKEVPGGGIILVDGEITSYERVLPFLHKRIEVQSHLWTQLKTRLHRDRRARGTSLKKTLHIFYQSNLLDYPRFASKSAPDVLLYRKSNQQLHYESSTANKGQSKIQSALSA
ncbi:MAG: zeta toxin family protein [Kiritimatiellae bacterium]|jgi:uridine kinase|nr:zeta toxin family protein [Kiritimatiellia bacterium]